MLLCKEKDAKSISKIGQAIVVRYKDIQGTGTIVLCDLACSLAQEHPPVFKTFLHSMLHLGSIMSMAAPGFDKGGHCTSSTHHGNP